ncbi:MAG: hypothetical protein NZT92_09205 [Abditibacteriales bacterium]|nr:hypothetical protein [Abditibacteriales bacterium]MDW8364560.1 sugar-binding protein [Abditibacteriales bacterium]
MLMAIVCPAWTQNDKPRKKLIEYGWDVPYPDFVRQHVREMEQRPFDGIVLRLRGGMNVFLHKPYDPQQFTQDIEHAKAIQWQKFSDNFVLMWATCDEGWDWFSEEDWKAAEHNVRLFAQVAKAGRCVGICFDPEPYGGNPWHYPSAPRAKEKPFDAFYQQVRQRGAQFIQTIQKELPGAKVLTFFQMSLFGAFADEPDPAVRMRRLASEGYGLLPAFLNGMLDAAEPNVVIIDGNEPAYYYTASEPYFRAYHLMRQRGLTLIAPENRRKYTLQVQAGFALYMDQLFALREPQEKFLSFYLTPEERARWFEHNVYYALYTTDEYVWCYSERMNWWENKVPPGAEEAIRSARQKIEQGKPLGFSIQEMIAAAQKKMQSEQSRRMIKRSAVVPRIPAHQKPPVIDGKLDDALYQQLKPLETFVPNAASGRTQPEAQTMAWVTYDDRFLYVAFRCEEPQPERMQVVGQAKDDPIWQGDVVEVLISKGESPKPYVHFILNPKNVQWDGVSADENDDASFNAHWQSAVVMGAREWTAEMAIPWAALGGVPQPGERRRANLCRQRGAGHEWSTWSSVVAGFLEAENFGVWTFGE